MTREATLVPGIYRMEDAEANGGLITTVSASFRDLVRLLGDPNSPGDGYKVTTEWSLETEEGVGFRLYDYKETELYDEDLPSVKKFRAQSSYDWHIGGQSGAWVQIFMRDLRTSIRKLGEKP